MTRPYLYSLPDSETKILHNELACTISESGRKDRVISDRDRAIVGLTEQLTEASVTILMQATQISWFKQKGPTSRGPER